MADNATLTEVRNLVDSLKGAVEQKNGALEVKNQEAFAKINERLDAIELGVKKAQVTASDKNVDSASLAEFKKAFGEFATGDRRALAQKQVEAKSYFRNAEQKAALVRFDIAAAGALLAPAQIADEIFKNVVGFTPILQVARVTPTTRADYKRDIRTSTPGVTWLAEAEAGSYVTPQYKQVSIPPQKAAASYQWSIEMQDDAAYDLVRELTEAFREDFAAGFGTATMTGDGLGKPYGMVGRVTEYNSGAVALTTNMLIQMQEQLKEEYQQNASWMMTRLTRAYIRSLVLSSTNGLQYTWEPDFKRQSPTLLLGAPVYIAKEGDLAGRVSGNFTAGQVPLLYGDFNQGYEVTRHTDMYVIDDPYSSGSSFKRNFHIMSRFGGNVTKEEAIVQLSITNS